MSELSESVSGSSERRESMTPLRVVGWSGFDIPVKLCYYTYVGWEID